MRPIALFLTAGAIAFAASAAAAKPPASAGEAGGAAPPPPYYAVGANVDGAVAFDMATLRRDGDVASIRVWRFSPAPSFEQDRFHVGSVYTAELDCAGGRLRLSGMAHFANLDTLEPDRVPQSHWGAYTPPAGPPDPSLATTAWRLLCREELPRAWVAYDRLDMIALDYWSSLAPSNKGANPYAVAPPGWAGPNARESTIPRPPQPPVDAPPALPPRL
jgi:hypothetical protein